MTSRSGPFDADPAVQGSPPDASGEERLRELGFDLSPVAQLVVDRDGRLSLANGEARSLFGLTDEDAGRPLRDVRVSRGPFDLRPGIETALRERRPVDVRDAAVTTADGSERGFDVLVSPLLAANGELLGATVAFCDAGRARALGDELDSARLELETAYDELRSTVEELERTNEELRSTNGELRSTNGALESMSGELRDRTDAALEASALLASVLAGVPQAVVALDPDLRIRVWSDAAAALWGLRADDARGRLLGELDIGLAVDRLRAPVLETLVAGPPDDLQIDGLDRGGGPTSYTVTFGRLVSHAGETDGVVLVIASGARKGPGEGAVSG